MSDITYTVIRSKRKTVALVVDAQGQLILRVPHFVLARELEEIVEGKRAWILRKQAQAAKRREAAPSDALKEGDALPYLGEEVVLARGDVAEVTVKAGVLTLPMAMTREGFLDWLRLRATQELNRRLRHYAVAMGVRPNRVRLSDARTRWGSCSGKDSINLSWRLILCAPAAMDYVVVHELCHLLHKNHSPAFWVSVAAVLPGYRQQREWLREHGGLILLFR